MSVIECVKYQISVFKIPANLVSLVSFGKARQGKFICIAHFIHNGNPMCFTKKNKSKGQYIKA